MRRRLGFVLLLISTAPTFGASDPCSQQQSNSDLKLELKLADGRKEFRTGERIPLELAISSSILEKYSVSNRSYDRSGRLSMEVYCLAPSAPDPLESYFGQGFFMGGGLFSERDPGEESFVWSSDLNEWKALPPGSYHLYVVTDRASLVSGELQDGRARNGLFLRSNEISFEIVAADNEWKTEQVRQAQAVLTEGGAPDAMRAAARVLRFLDTPEAIEAMARLYGMEEIGNPYQFELMLGLNAASNRRLVVDALKRELVRPDHPVTPDVVSTLVRLQIVEENLPQAKTQEEFVRRRAHEKELRQQALRLVAGAVATKTGKALGITLTTVLSENTTPEVAAQLAPQLVAQWDSMPETYQVSWLRERWELIRGPAMQDPLRKMLAYRDGARATGEMGIALIRLHELDPQGAEEALLDEFKHPNQPMMPAAISLFSKDNAEIAMTFAQERLQHGSLFGGDYELIKQYGNKEQLDEMKRIYEAKRGTWPCEAAVPLLQYFLRVDRTYGEGEAWDVYTTQHRMCRQRLLEEVHPLPAALQTATIAELENPDLRLASQAARGLEFAGDEKAEKVLWDRLKRFHTEWEGHEKELRFAGKLDDKGRIAANFEQAMMDAIAQAKGWTVTPEKLEQLRSLLWLKQHTDQVDQWLDQWKNHPFVREQTYVGSPTQYSVFQYWGLSENELRNKLRQFPPGTRLVWQIWPPEKIAPTVTIEEQLRRYAVASAIAAEANLTIERVDLK